MGQVKITPLVENRLRELEEILYEQNYFSFRETAKDYVNSIYDFISTIPEQRRHSTKSNKYGAFYCQYKLNKNTSYFLTFDMENDTYLVKNVISNHTKEYPEFIKG
jgi:hypothetical protein